ncbi:hypothetical protein Z517_06282 [Fonsecaea pedrosoi CBS 271.37]|uniref:Unplaced genomic scaffold supercont1.4, whole genome shotgun sequence n=1 Tax=Fonsecaea pedrosoi CBS 271.37 TaxID=1442368 RepID=A0A0D2GFT1_9EURO|nr:uncharacterized protein Z517_06282 [Fonsecaea pedrosoi CBS 271.37]KIW79668.1 hypothetical protein Z517_06282 [Fonsecaea pedrosoi CBS 271.37]
MSTPSPPAATGASAVIAARSSVYKPLNSWQTRLIKLLPGHEADPLRCELHAAAIINEAGLGVAEVYDAVQYTALSYSWGHPTCTAPIDCNGVQVFIPPPLADALRHVRHVDKHRWVWCDALCIDQQNTDEKAAQVKQMLLIFRKAERVIAWIGTMSGPVIRTLAKVIGQPVENVRHWRYDPQEIKADRVETVKLLLQRPWFRRTWVRQEVYAARRLDLQVGHHSMLFGNFVDFVKTCREMTPQLDSLSSSRLDAEFQGQASLTTLAFCVFGDNKDFDASDDRDRIYGLIGMLERARTGDAAGPEGWTDQLLQRFPIDYTEGVTASVVYQRFMSFLMASEDKLKCLETSGTRYSSANMPSWAIDWRNSDFHYGAYQNLHFWISGVPGRYYNKAELADPDFWELPVEAYGKEEWTPPQYLETENQLRLKGARLGAINSSQIKDVPPEGWRWYYEERIAYRYRSKFIEERRRLDRMLFHKDFKAMIVSDDGVVDDSDHVLAGRCGVVVTGDVKDGDLVVQLVGSKMVHILRPTDKEGTFSLVCAGWYWRLPTTAEKLYSESIGRTLPVEKPYASVFDVSADFIFYCDIQNFANSLPGLIGESEIGPTRWERFEIRVVEATGGIHQANRYGHPFYVHPSDDSVSEEFTRSGLEEFILI